MTTGRINQVTIATDKTYLGPGSNPVPSRVESMLTIGAPGHTVSLRRLTYKADFTPHQYSQ